MGWRARGVRQHKWTDSAWDADVLLHGERKRCSSTGAVTSATRPGARWTAGPASGPWIGLKIQYLSKIKAADINEEIPTREQSV